MLYSVINLFLQVLHGWMGDRKGILPTNTPAILKGSSSWEILKIPSLAWNDLISRK